MVRGRFAERGIPDWKGVAIDELRAKVAWMESAQESQCAIIKELLADVERLKEKAGIQKGEE